MRRLRLALLTTLLVVALLSLSAGQAVANHIQCGEVITQDTTLDADLIDCPNDGTVLGADTIPLDLNGHLIDGDGLLALAPCDVDVGVVNGKAPDFRCPPPPGAHDGVTIRDGVVREFGFGVSADAASNGAVHSMTISATYEGIFLQDGAADNLVTQNSVSDSRDGISLREAGPDNRIERNSVLGNRSEATGLGTGSGILVDGSADGNRIERNSLSGNDVGVLLSDSFGATLIKHNSVLDNGAGIWLIESQNTRIERNRVLRSNGGPDNDLAAPGDGIHVDDKRNEIVANTASLNRNDGIEVIHPENTLTRNSANRNGDFGIEAISGVVDGGGNIAFGNGNPLQCLNVFCKTNGRPR
jgi:parallel beta-helix repeat protein